MVEIARLKEELRKIVKELKELGVPEGEIVEIITKVETTLEKLIVSQDYRVFYGNTEVVLEPLHRAVYILFLKHPEGIRFKELPDYREELTKIYNSMKSDTLVPMKIKQSIINVTDPISHSINEKCARIKTAFRKVAGSEAVSTYAIVGQRGEIKKIRLDRSLVIWEQKESPPV